MLGRLLLFFIVVPLLEVALLSVLSDWLGWHVTLLVVVVTCIVGAWLARQQGWQVIRRLRADAADGRLPAVPLLEGVLILLAGVLLITPGLLTDVVGLALLIPFSRRICQAWLVRWFCNRFLVIPSDGVYDPRAPGGKEVIDSYVVDEPRDDRRIEE